MTIPDIRDLPGLKHEKRSLDNNFKECVGYICASVIVIFMLYFDGEVAIAAAAGVAGTLAGINFLKGGKDGKEV